MLTILNLFGRSPFALLQAHMEIVSKCMDKLQELFTCIQEENDQAAKIIAKEISKLEHDADLTKNDIRNHLPSSLYLPIARGDLLEILTLQDSLADQAEDIAILCNLRPLKVPESIKGDFDEYLEKNFLCYKSVEAIIGEMHDLLGSSFGGAEAEKVRKMVDQLAFREHEADLQQRKLLEHFFGRDDDMDYKSFYLWQKVLQAIAAIANISEKLGHRVRMTLDIK